MKFQSFVLLILVAIFSFSCADDLTNIGESIQPGSDEILIGTDTFHVSTENVFVESIYTRQDSFLLGTFYNEKYGSTQADILAQVNCPVGFLYPPQSIPDSVLVVLYYDTWFGDSYSPIDVNIYEMNLNTFNYTTHYPTNIDPLEYTDKSINLGRRIFTAQDTSGTRTYSTYISFKMDAAFVNRFFDDSYYASETEFQNKFFKGLYITANFGASTILNVSQIDMEMHYHYTAQKNGRDTVITDVKTFPANKEVRQVNRFVHNDRDVLVKQKDSVNYIASPANINTRVKIPLKRMAERMKAKTGNKTLTMNSALLNVEITDFETATIAMPVTSYLLLIKEDSIDNFFKKNKLPDDTYAIVSQYSYAQIGTSGVYGYSYSFDTATLIANEIKNNEVPDENLNMLLVPVRITTDSYYSVTEIKQQFLMSGVTIKSGINPNSPMRINAVFTGF
ncbi:MAG: DUF4270 domain-containing protein [Paludibacter sp.]|nr:DUF4270 domain-containing protein [Paludibacter sp.]